MSYYKRRLIKKLYRNCDLKTSSKSFCVCKLYWKMKFLDLLKIFETVYFSSYSVKCISWFKLRHLMLKNLNTWKVKLSLSEEQKELLKRNKKHCSLFHKWSLLEIQNELTEVQWRQIFKVLFRYYFCVIYIYHVMGASLSWLTLFYSL